MLDLYCSLLPHRTVSIIMPGFLQLPAELRNEIYEYALTSNSRRRPGDIYARLGVDPLPVDPPLLRVNRQIRQEAIGIYYGVNKFVFRVTDFNIQPLLAWFPLPQAGNPFTQQNQAVYWRRQSALRYRVIGMCNWTNFRAWVRQYFHNAHGLPSPVGRMRLSRVNSINRSIGATTSQIFQWVLRPNATFIQATQFLVFQEIWLQAINVHWA